MRASTVRRACVACSLCVPCAQACLQLSARATWRVRVPAFTCAPLPPTHHTHIPPPDTLWTYTTTHIHTHTPHTFTHVTRHTSHTHAPNFLMALSVRIQGESYATAGSSDLVFPLGKLCQSVSNQRTHAHTHTPPPPPLSPPPPLPPPENHPVLSYSCYSCLPIPMFAGDHELVVKLPNLNFARTDPYVTNHTPAHVVPSPHACLAGRISYMFRSHDDDAKSIFAFMRSSAVWARVSPARMDASAWFSPRHAVLDISACNGTVHPPRPVRG